MEGSQRRSGPGAGPRLGVRGVLAVGMVFQRLWGWGAGKRRPVVSRFGVQSGPSPHEKAPGVGGGRLGKGVSSRRETRWARTPVSGGGGVEPSEQKRGRRFLQSIWLP